jgi:two-component system sensor histidine kinase MtrB
MKPRAHKLSGILAVIAAVVTGLAVIASGALIILTTYLHRTTMVMASTVESVRLAEEAAIDLLLHQRVTDSIVKLNIEGDLQRRLTSAREYVTTDEEALVMGRALSSVEAYIAASRQASLPAQLHALYQDAYGALEDLIRINTVQAHDEQEQAARWDRLANFIGVTTIGLLLLVVGWLLWWLRARALRPVLALAHIMERYGRGDRAARAEEAGPLELRDIAKQFNQMAASIDSQRDAQMAFLGGVAHDLRNPLAVLKTSASLLGPGVQLPPEPELRRMFEIINRQVTHLERMVGDFLDMASIEAGELALKLDVQDMGALVQEICRLFESASPNHQIAVSIPDAPVLLQCDPLRIEQVVNNLVGNAIKYSPRGGMVRVAVTRERCTVIISVADQGIGISAEDQRHLFEPFRRVGPSKQTVPGLGLGLFVVSKIVAAHGGRIEVESSPSRGATFRVHLPLSGSEPQAVPTGTRSDEGERRQPIH